MKRNIAAIILICALLFSLPACQTAEENQKVYDLLTGYASAAPSHYTICLTVTGPEGNEVTTTYHITGENGVRAVTYRKETLNRFDLSAGMSAPESYLSVTEGALEESESANEAFALPRFRFSSGALRNFSVKKSALPYTFTAEIVSCEAFMGRAVDAGNITLTGSYTSGALNEVTLSWKTGSGNTVTLSYLYR